MNRRRETLSRDVVQCDLKGAMSPRFVMERRRLQQGLAAGACASARRVLVSRSGKNSIQLKFDSQMNFEISLIPSIGI